MSSHAVAENFKAFKARVVREYLVAALERNDWDVRATAAECGINRTEFFRKMSQYGIKRPRKVGVRMTSEFRAFLGLRH